MDGAPPAAPRLRRGLQSRRGALAAALVALVFDGSASAQTQQELATRRLLIERATAARAAGRHAEALALAQRAGAVRMSPSVRLFIAQEMDTLGDPAGALGMADQCVREVERDRAVAHRDALLSTCRALVGETRARIGYLVVRAPDPAPEGLRVTVRDAPLNPALLGVPNAVSPGEVTVVASAPGRVSFTATRAIAPGATAQVELDLPSEPATPPPPPEPVVAPPEPAAPPPARVVLTAPPRSPSRLAPALLLGGGAAALAGGAALLALRGAALRGCSVDDGAAVCDTQDDLDAAREANGLAIGAGVLLGAGALAVGTGVVWLLRARRSPTGPQRLAVDLAPTLGGARVGFTGRFP